MKNKNLLTILIIVAAVIVIFIVYFSINSVSKVENFNANEPLLIGGQKDAHGCLIAAGYSWCEPKQKCLHIWEEHCFVAQDEALSALFAVEHNKPVADTIVTISKMQNNYASGSIKFGSVQGESGAFLVRLMDNGWVIDYEGNGSIDCVKIRSFGYPQEVLEGYCD